MSNWSRYYQSRIGEGYAKFVEKKYAPLLYELLQGNPGSYREEGCGIGTITKCLVKTSQAHHVMTDLDNDQLALTRINVPKIITSQLNIVNGIAEKVDVIHSHGVLEHFEDTDIHQILKRQVFTPKFRKSRTRPVSRESVHTLTSEVRTRDQGA